MALLWQVALKLISAPVMCLWNKSQDEGLRWRAFDLQTAMLIPCCLAQSLERWEHYTCDINVNGPPAGPGLHSTSAGKENGGEEWWGKKTEEEVKNRRWQVRRDTLEASTEKNKRRKIKKDIPRMQECARVKVLVWADRGSKETDSRAICSPQGS